jgi:homopolymeric O-antigen transport system ATP-binding protein
MKPGCALSVAELGKRYKIGVERHGTFRDALAHPLQNIRARRRAEAGAAGHVWALKDVSFDVAQGEAVGIIGRNGAGKSTLLKVLARITRPTTGEATLAGAVGSLLEVGTGFHPELTGRENVYLNGAILGMTKSYIDRRFDEIVAFAETDRFVDTPVKRYSSGMQMRLAFAVAAHLEPEILLVDEVLAVGDAQFQKKCLGKMSEVAEEGRTILFVSHNMGSIVRLCSRAIWIDRGRVQEDAEARDVVRSYLSVGETDQAARTWASGEGPGDDALRLTSVRITQEGEPTTNVHIDKPFEIEIETEVAGQTAGGAAVAIRILNPEGDILLESSEVMQEGLPTRARGRWTTVCSLPAYALNGGSYYLSLFADVPNVRLVFSEESVLKWTVESVSSGMDRYGPGGWKGVLGPGLPQWSLRGFE